MTKQININADMGEGYGVYQIGNDIPLLKYVRSTNIACGMHAGDANVMRMLCENAVKEGVSIGCHPGFNDVWGFGRRRIDMKPVELENLIAYQIGALQGMAAYAGAKVTHLKPHGALNNMAAEDAEYAMAIGRAMKAVDPKMIYVALGGSEMEKAAIKLGLSLAREGFCDRLYDDDGNLTSRKIPGAVMSDPEQAKRNVLSIVLDGTVISRNGKRIKHEVESLCIHGDEPTSVKIAQAVCQGLTEAGVKIVPLTEMKLPA